MTIGENIRRIRQERHLTQKQLGEMVGASEAIFVHTKAAEGTPSHHPLRK